MVFPVSLRGFVAGLGGVFAGFVAGGPSRFSALPLWVFRRFARRASACVSGFSGGAAGLSSCRRVWVSGLRLSQVCFWFSGVGLRVSPPLAGVRPRSRRVPRRLWPGTGSLTGRCRRPRPLGFLRVSARRRRRFSFRVSRGARRLTAGVRLLKNIGSRVC